MSARATTLIMALGLLTAAPASAQRGARVLVFDAGDEWSHSLGIELAYAGGRVIEGHLSAPTPGSNQALAARVAAQVAGADAAIWIGRDGRWVHVVLADSEQGFAAPLAAADGRTVALVAASLLDEALAITSAPPPASVPSAPSLSARLASPYPPAVQATDDERVPVDRPLPRRAGPDSQLGFFVMLGTGGLAHISDISFDPGTFLRLIFGVQVHENVRIQLDLEGGVFRERIGVNGGGLELQPFGRACPEVVGFARVDSLVGLQIGAHGCVGVAELRHHSFFEDPFGPPGFRFSEGAVATAAGGGFVGVELRPSPKVSITIRADVDGTGSLDPIARQPDVLASISTVVGFW